MSKVERLGVGVGFLAAVLGLLMLPPPALSQTGPKIEVVPGQSHAGAVASIAVTVDGTRASARARGVKLGRQLGQRPSEGKEGARSPRGRAVLSADRA